MPAIRPEVFHVFRLEKTLSQASDVTAKSLKRKRQMERVRSLSLEDRAEALTETHLIPLITEKVVQQLISQLITDHLKQSRKRRRDPQKA